MKIFLPFEVKDIGGPSTFANKFKQGMEKKGHTVSFDPCSDYDVLFVIVQCPFRHLLDAKRKGKPIVQRLDGVYYWAVAGWRFPLFNLKALLTRHFFTDFTIYQSEYSKRMAISHLGPKFNDQNKIIINGVDTSQFSPVGNIKRVDAKKEHVFITASAFRRPDQIDPLIESLELYSKKYDSNFVFGVAGSFKGRVAHYPEKLKKIKFVRMLGKIPNHELPSYLRGSDVFLFTHTNSACPNNIVEALGCGLPICGVADGAMPELVDAGKTGLLVPSKGDAYWHLRYVDRQQFCDNLHELMSNQTKYSKNARTASTRKFSLERMIDSYEAVIKNQIKRKKKRT